MHRVKEFMLFLLVKVLLEAEMRWYVTMPLFYCGDNYALMFWRKQLQMLISASAAATAEFLQSPTDLGDVSELENAVQPISWLSPSCLWWHLLHHDSRWAQQERTCLMGKSVESCLLASSSGFITAAWAQLGMYCRSLHVSRPCGALLGFSRLLESWRDKNMQCSLSLSPAPSTCVPCAFLQWCCHFYACVLNLWPLSLWSPAS